MSKLVRSTGTAGAVFLTALLAFPLPLEAGNIVDCPVQAASASPDRPRVEVRGNLNLYSDLASFQAVAGAALPLETFDGGAISEPGDGIDNCPEPVDAASDDPCFSPGDLIGGFNLTSTSGGGYAVLGDNHPQVGQDGLAIGPMDISVQDFPNVAAVVTFTENDVTAVAMNVIPGCNGLDVTVRVHDRQDTLIGTTTISVDASWHSGFVGLVTPRPVGHIELATSPSGGQLIQNLRFGPALDKLFRDRFEP